jgi:hypothetical protein
LLDAHHPPPLIIPLATVLIEGAEPLLSVFMPPVAFAAAPTC